MRSRLAMAARSRVTVPTVEVDAELLARWSRNDRVAGNALFQRHFAVVHRFFVNKVRDSIAAEDLVQLTFLRLAECAVNYRGRSSFRSFVFGVARNVLREHFRDRERRGVESLEDLSVVELGAGPSSVAVAREELRVLLEALRRVPLSKQMILELYYFEQASGAELAEFLGVSLNTARSRLRMALEKLREVIATTAPIGVYSQALLDDIEEWTASLQEAIGLARAQAT
jgi:RNA polymerase sigma-70 factor, ECF subfamily